LPEEKYTLEMIGDSLREAGTLLLVFTPLYELFEHYPPPWYIVLAVIATVIGLLLAGIEVERRRA
jgi:hypothetical protein